MRPGHKPPLDLLRAQHILRISPQLMMNNNRIRRAGEDQDLAGERAQALPGLLIAGQRGEADGGHEGVREAGVVVELPADGVLDG